MLLAERVGKAADQTWTCVDPSLRVQIARLQDKQSVFTKPPRDLSIWAPFPGLTDKTRDMALAASSRLLARQRAGRRERQVEPGRGQEEGLLEFEREEEGLEDGGAGELGLGHGVEPVLLR
eukprot:5884275-Pyramimonas_sp.AAC.1